MKKPILHVQYCATKPAVNEEVLDRMAKLSNMINKRFSDRYDILHTTNNIQMIADNMVVLKVGADTNFDKLIQLLDESSKYKICNESEEDSNVTSNN